MNKNNHKKVKYCDEVQFNRAKNNYFYYDAIEYNGIYEVTKRARKVYQNMPIQIACSIYDDSKLRMLQFYYDCIDKYIDRSDFQYLEMDTDSAYMAITGDKLEDIVKPELKNEFIQNYNKWFVTDKHSNRTPGLFKVEFEGEIMVALCSKTYYVWGDRGFKASSKGLQKRGNTSIINKDKYLQCLNNKEVINGVNKGFRYDAKEMKTYEQHKVGLSPIYTKGVVMDDGVHIRPIIFNSLAIDNNTPLNLEVAPARSTAMKNNTAAPARSTATKNNTTASVRSAAYNDSLNHTELLEAMFSNALGLNHS